jgi:ankyrin repeat protein
VSSCLQQGASINYQNERKWTLIFAAAAKGNFEVFKLLYDSGANPGIKNINDNTVLHASAQGGNLEIIKMLTGNEEYIEQYINATNNSDETALIKSIVVCNPEIVAELIAQKADLNIMMNHQETNEQATALSIAICKDYRLMLPEERRNPKSKNYKNDLERITVDYAKIAKLLIENGDDLNLKHDRGFTVFLFSAVLGRDKILQLLIDKGVDFNECYDKGDNALMIAIKNQHWKVIDLLLDPQNISKIDINAQGAGVLTVLHLLGYLMKNNKHLQHQEIFKQLLDIEDLEVNIQDVNGFTPVMVALYVNAPKKIIMSLLRRPKVDLSVISKGRTELELALQYIVAIKKKPELESADTTDESESEQALVPNTVSENQITLLAAQEMLPLLIKNANLECLGKNEIHNLYYFFERLGNNFKSLMLQNQHS